jgi:hypothetical protein
MGELEQSARRTRKWYIMTLYKSNDRRNILAADRLNREPKSITGMTVNCVGVGSMFVCLAPKIVRDEIEPLALGIVCVHKELRPAGERQVVFRDSAFAADVAKTSLTAILRQNGLENVRSR